MRRDSAAAAVLLTILGTWSCADKQAPSPPPPSPTPRCLEVAEVNVTLAPRDQVCVAAVPSTQNRVCVVQGGVVRWRIHNACRDLKSTTQPAFEVANVRIKKTAEAPKWAFEGCSLRLDDVPLERTPKGQVLLCGVPVDADPEVYKYDIQGAEIERLDPDIEVRRP